MGTWAPGPGATAGNDTFTGDATDETADGLAGDDTLIGAGGTDTLTGGVGADSIDGGIGADTIIGDDGDDVLLGENVLSLSQLPNSGADIINGGAGNDLIFGGAGSDTLNGGDGNDDIFQQGGRGGAFGNTAVQVRVWDWGADIMDGGAGYDRGYWDFSNQTTGVVFALGAPDVVSAFTISGVFAGSVTGIEEIAVKGSASGDNQLAGGAGPDFLVGGQGSDMLSGGSGADILQGGMGGVDVLIGGEGDDAYYIDNGTTTVVEAADAGNDAIIMSFVFPFPITYNMADYPNIEQFYISGIQAFTLIARPDGNALSGGSGDDTLLGNIGPDLLFGGAGHDVLRGEVGNDNLDGGAGADEMRGGPGDDGYVVDDNGDVVIEDSGGGRDHIQFFGGTAASLSLYGLPSNVEDAYVTVGFDITVEGNATDNHITASTAANVSLTLRGMGGDDTIIGGSGHDTIDGGAGNDILYGGPYLTAGVGNIFLGGAGDDSFSLESAGDVVVEMSGEGTDTIALQSLSTFVVGSSAGGENVERILYAGLGNAVIVGGATACEIRGHDGADTLIGSHAGGSLDGGGGNDVLWFYGTTALQGGAGFDHAIQLDQTNQTRSLGPSGIEVYVGNIGNDTLDSVGATAFTIIYAGAGNDVVTQGAAGGITFGQDGADTLIGGAGADTLIGNAGSDSFAGNDGNDVIYIDAADGQNFDGGAGGDYAIVEGAAAVSLTLAGRNVEVFVSNDGNDTIDASGVSYAMGLYGFGGDDVITGARSSSQLFGMDGNDTLSAGAINDAVLGGNGADRLFGNAGDDLLIGEAGDDLIVGGAGADVLWGDVNGTGSDTFRFASVDVQAGVRDQVIDLGDVAGNQDIIQFAGVAQNQVTIANDGGGNVLLTIAASGGTYTILVIGMSAAAIQDDIFFGP